MLHFLNKLKIMSVIRVNKTLLKDMHEQRICERQVQQQEQFLFCC